MKKHRIFTTYGETPIKNIKTPIRRFSGDPEEETVTPQEEIVYTEISDNSAILGQIRTLLVVIIILKIICMCIKK